MLLTDKYDEIIQGDIPGWSYAEGMTKRPFLPQVELLFLKDLLVLEVISRGEYMTFFSGSVSMGLLNGFKELNEHTDECLPIMSRQKAVGEVTMQTLFLMKKINMGVAAKMKEYGSMRAIGRSNRQLVKMIIAIVLLTAARYAYVF